ncbi:MAG TPA: FKBP-type peptidyl-prolyl cis-trans isomerase [Solirubrobacterales bacterium]|nr:FKBP-type peptidyl-prolyl cis-trans isomerase [Solirubrobacterales bacterium]
MRRSSLRSVSGPIVLAVLLGLAGCGGQGEDATSASPAAFGSKPKVKPSDFPIPKKLVVKDVWVGSGPAVKPGDEIEIQFVDLNLVRHTRFESEWKGDGAVWRLGEEELSKGFERGIVGMRVGGRREILFPSRLGYGTGPMVYVLDLLAIR